MTRKILTSLCFIWLSIHYVQGQCPGHELSRIDWDVATWLDGSMQAGYGFGTNALTIHLKGSTAPGFPNQDRSFDKAGGLSDGGNALVIANHMADTISIDLLFESSVQDLTFSLYDIDLDDNLKISTDGSDAVISPVMTDPTFAVAESWIVGNGQKSDNDPHGTVDVHVASASSVTIMIIRNKGNIYAGLSDIQACTSKSPEPSNCSQDKLDKLDWGGYPAGELQHQMAIETHGHGKIHASISFTGDTEHFNNTQKNTKAPDDTDRFSKTDGGFGDGSHNLQVRVDPPATATKSSIMATLDLDVLVYDMRFSVFDIDNNTSAQIDSSDRIDQVIITGYLGDQMVMPTLQALSNSPAWSRSDNVVTAHPFGEKDAEDGGTRNTLNVYFTKAVDRVTIEYNERGYTDPQRPTNYDPTRRTIALSPIFFCTSPHQATEIQSFEVNEENGVVNVEWLTRNEQNANHFQVLKSLDMKDFVAIGSLPAIGRESQSNSYLLMDRDFVAEVGAFYRLKVVGDDGTTALSDIKTIPGMVVRDELFLYPNPVREHLNLTGMTSQRLCLQIRNANGVLVRQEEIDDGQQDRLQLSVDDLSSGMYHITVHQESSSQTIPFIKIE